MVRRLSTQAGDSGRRWTGPAAASLVLLAAVSWWGCGAEGTEAPPPPLPEESSCQPMSDTLSELFKMLRHPTAPLSGLREVVVEISRIGEEECERRRMVRPDAACEHPVGAILDAVVRGFLTFSRDPDEVPGTRCLEIAPATGENRMCTIRRALDFGVRDAAVSVLFDRLNPLMARLLGWISNDGPGADGSTHWEPVMVLQRAAANPGLCNPAHLIDAIDSLVTYWRPDESCRELADGDSCRSLAALSLLRELVSDPALQEFLKLFEAEDGSGRVAFQRVAALLMQRMADMPNDERYFDSVDRLASDLLYPFLDSDPERYGSLKSKLEDSLAIARSFLDPSRDQPILKEFKGIMACLSEVDREDRHLVGAAYDLLLRPVNGSPPVDLVELVTLLEEIVRLDTRRNGVLLGAVQTMLRGTRADEQGTEAMRRLLVEILTRRHAQLVFPPLRLMVERGVLSELVILVDELLYGCRDAG